MTREWKPGDFQLFVDEQARRFTWRKPDEAIYGPPSKGAFNYRPLVVIDPEDREQVSRLAAAWDSQTHAQLDEGAPMTLSGWRMQAALRSQIEPPKPDEPTGLGAVVEDSAGDQWVRIRITGPDVKPADQWRTWWGHRDWDDISAVRVLSDGVRDV